ncbi:MAG TPA: hypothetical protein QF887_02015, partial [SAR324 cluster bacterium]|nr:hypothetical protein [SAR324 cluster bacterium]
TEASLFWEPSMILGMSLIRSSELPIPASRTAVVAASVTSMICELEREFVRVLLVDLMETRVMLPLLDDLELLVELRLVFSSLMTLEDNEELVELEETLEEISE